MAVASRADSTESFQWWAAKISLSFMEALHCKGQALDVLRCASRSLADIGPAQLQYKPGVEAVN